MDDKLLIASRVALELRPGTLVNLGIGLPTLVASLVPRDAMIFFQSENGIIGMQSMPEQGLEDEDLTDAGGRPISALPGAATFDSAMSFGLIRGGHLDVTVLGGLQVDRNGRLANWTVPGKMLPGMGGAMDLVTGARRVIVAMTHTAKGEHKIVDTCTLPLTSTRCVDLVVTELAVLQPTPEGMVLKELAPGVSIEQVQAATGTRLIVAAQVTTMDGVASSALNASRNC
jgi:acetate CoA/acetoacetate CoA-transferase beta subunit